MKDKWASALKRAAIIDDEDAWIMLATWCEQTDNYWPGLFWCYSDPRIPATNNALEQLIKEMKQLERVLSRNPRPAIRFILHAATNALVTSRPQLPGADFLAQLGAEAIQKAEARLRSERKQRGVRWRAIRDFDGAKIRLLEHWEQACQEADRSEVELAA